MPLLLAIVASLLALLAACVVACNYAALVVSRRNRRAGITHQPSMVFIVAPLLSFVAANLASKSSLPAFSGFAFALIAILDPSLWVLVAYPLLRFSRRSPPT